MSNQVAPKGERESHFRITAGGVAQIREIEGSNSGNQNEPIADSGLGSYSGVAEVRFPSTQVGSWTAVPGEVLEARESDASFGTVDDAQIIASDFPLSIRLTMGLSPPGMSGQRSGNRSPMPLASGYVPGNFWSFWKMRFLGEGSREIVFGESEDAYLPLILGGGIAAAEPSRELRHLTTFEGTR